MFQQHKKETPDKPLFKGYYQGLTVPGAGLEPAQP